MESRTGDLHAGNVLLRPGAGSYRVQIIDFGMPSIIAGVTGPTGEESDLHGLATLLRQLFFFPDVNAADAETLRHAHSLPALRSHLLSVLATPFGTALVNPPTGYVGVRDLEELAKRLGRIALTYVRDRILSCDVNILVQPYLGSDVVWHRGEPTSIIVLSSGPSRRPPGAFLLLTAL